MNSSYDVCVDYDILCGIEDKLQLIGYDLNCSTEQMLKAIQSSQNFLTGKQFEKAKRTTMTCMEFTRKTGNNIKHVMEYIAELKSALEEYGRCGYNGEAE